MSTLSAAPSDFQALIAAHRSLILKVAASYSSNRDDRADLAQEIALQLWRAWPGYEPTRPFSTWLYRVALNVAISQLRRERRRRYEPLTAEHEALLGTEGVDVGSQDRLALVQRAMQSMGAFDRALLLLHLEGCSHRESGEVLGITESNVGTRLNRIRQHLRRITAQGDDRGNA
jgi:RNA polymerase sigma-70 factor, ECF subfamily